MCHKRNRVGTLGTSWPTEVTTMRAQQNANSKDKGEFVYSKFCTQDGEFRLLFYIQRVQPLPFFSLSLSLQVGVLELAKVLTFWSLGCCTVPDTPLITLGNSSVNYFPTKSCLSWVGDIWQMQPPISSWDPSGHKYCTASWLRCCGWTRARTYNNINLQNQADCTADLHEMCVSKTTFQQRKLVCLLIAVCIWFIKEWGCTIGG